MIPGRYGRVEWSDGRALAVYCDHPKLFGSSGPSRMSGGTRRRMTRCAPCSRPKRWSRSQRSSERNGGVGRDEDAPRISAQSLDNWPLLRLRSHVPDSGGSRAAG